MSVSPTDPSGAVLSPCAARKVAPIWHAAEAAASLVSRPAMVRGEVSAAQAVVAAGAALAGSAVGLAFFLSRKPTGATGDSHAKFRA